MSRKMTSALVFILAALLATVPAWSSTPGPIYPAGSGKNLTTDLNTTADTIFKTAIILARGGGGGNGHGGGGPGGHGNGVGDGTCDGEGPDGPSPGPGLAGPDGASIGRP